MKRTLSFMVAVLLLLCLSACDSDRDTRQDIIDRSMSNLSEIDKVEKESDRVSDLIDQYKNGK